MMFFTEPVRTSPYSLDYYPCYHPVVFLSARARAARYLAEQRERAWALRYQQQPCMMHVLRSCAPQHEDKIGHIMACKHAEMQWTMMQQLQDMADLRSDIEEEQIFAHHRADAEKFLEEAETYLEDFLPPDQEPCLTIFEPFDLPDDSMSTSTSEVIVQDEPLLKDVIEDCVMSESHRAAEYRSEVLNTLQSILGCLSADTSTEVLSEHVPVPSTTAETSRKEKAKGIPGFEEDFVAVELPAQAMPLEDVSEVDVAAL
ncbi:uncharacterized protein F5147DRAFT_715615 [Suillus discolor]|uniref:Uncharacterized protein n=1 Tax=Suillus discolor TaxID=1912936 RepID=A0A9P7EZP2_9AGAM|nr:uncharacterized protein F5147DRAFT_715615 [Suillus discolor]KAG2096986.1 hypothetical protein F5147DRAFT_715615 [Suillus discolor]